MFHRRRIAFSVFSAWILIWAALGCATEWTVGQPLSPSITANGQAAVQFNDTLYIFASSENKVVYQRIARDTDKFTGHWESLPVDTDEAPAVAVFEGKLYLFTKGRGDQRITYRIFDGRKWTEPSVPLGNSSVAPAAAADGNTLYIVMLTESGELLYRKLVGSNWSKPTKLSGKYSSVAPAVAIYDGELFVSIRALDGKVYLRTIAKPYWSGLGSHRTSESPALAVSGNRLFLLSRAEDGSVWFRILDRSHGRNDLVPTNRWMPVGRGYAESPLSVSALDDSIFVFYRKNRVLPGPLGLRSTPAIFYKMASWTEAPLAIIQGADPGCVNKANLANVGTWIEYANSVYAPLMVRFNWALTVQKCGYEWQATDGFKDTWDKAKDNESTLAADPEMSNMVWVAVRARAAGGAFAGYGSRIIAMPEGMLVCGDQGLSGPKNFYQNDLAHELGHYFGLQHTFKGPPKTKGDLQQMLEDVGFDPVRAFDYDAKGSMYYDAQSGETVSVFDTPPDPHHELFGVSVDKCKDANAPVFFSGASNEKACSMASQCIGAETCMDGKCVIKLVPPRLNAMSYYQVSDTVINRFSPGQAAVIYKALRARGFAPGEADPSVKP